MKKPHGGGEEVSECQDPAFIIFFFPSMCSGMVETELGPSEVLRLKDDAVR